MRRERVLRNFEEPRQVAGRETLRFVLDQSTERLKPGALGERGEREDCLFVFHISRLTEIKERVNPASVIISNILEIRLTDWGGELILPA